MNYEYLPAENLYIDVNGLMYVLNEFNPNKLVYICVSGDIWESYYNTQNHYLDWSQLSFTKNMKTLLKKVLQELLAKNAPSYLDKARNALIAIDDSEFLSEANDFSKISSVDIFKEWYNLASTYRSYFREWYTMLSQEELGGTSFYIAQEMKTWKARENRLHLRDVLNWHETKGAFTKDEELLLRKAILNYKSVPTEILWIYIFCWLLLETLKRPFQILDMHKDSLKIIIADDGKKEYFALIRPMKFQTGDDERWWGIPTKLGEAIEFYGKINRVKTLQNKHNCLIVSECGRLNTANASSKLENHIKNELALISPRTGQLLHVKPLRIRHTGATRLAMRGVSRDLIQEILEHDSPESAKAYIDAVASELAPEIEKADRNMGSFFYHLNKAFFQGTITSEKPQHPIIIPVASDTLLIVGGCGKNTIKDGKCRRHPFIACYNGCSNFLAWREQDHRKALVYIEQEIKRWEKASGHTEQKAILKEYREVQEAIYEVINKIEADKSEE